MDGWGDPFDWFFNCFYGLAAFLVVVGLIAISAEIPAWRRMPR